MKRLVLVFLTPLIAAPILFGQTPDKSPAKPGAKSVARENQNRQALRRSALSALDSVIDELPEVEDLDARLSIAEGVVKVLAKSKPDRCRKILDSLFDEARKARKPGSPGNKVTGPNADALVETIVRLATLFDAKLAESYIERYSLPDDSDAAEVRAAHRDAGQAASLRLRMALELIDKNPAASVSIAESSLGAGVFGETLAFLGSLRNKDVKLANKFFVEALASVTSRQGGDVNELLLLYAYVFSPLRVPVVTPRGLGIFNIPAYLSIAKEYPVEPGLARLYLDAAGQVMLDPNRLNPQNLPFLTSGLEGDYYLISILQPAVATYAPALVEYLSARRAVVAGLLQPQQREASQAATERWDKIPTDVSVTGGGNPATADYFMERAEKTDDPVRKDQLYYRAASTAVRAKEYDRALKIVDKLLGPQAGEAKQFIKFAISLSAARNQEVDRAEFFASRDDDLTRRAFIFTVIAASLLEGKSADPERARGFLEETGQLVSKLGTDEEKGAVSFGLVSVYSRFDPALASQSLPAAIQAANKVEGFGRETGIQRGFEIGGYLFDYSLYDHELTFTDGIARLGAKDFKGTLSQIRLLKDRLPRLKATVLISGAVLSGAA